jgi:hypothetical protein
MLTESEIGIVDVFRKDLFGSYTIRELMKKTGRTTYPWTFNAVKKLSKMGILGIEVKGRSSICRINLDNAMAIRYLSLLDGLEAASGKVQGAEQIVYTIPASFFTLLAHFSGRTARFYVIAEDSFDSRKISGLARQPGFSFLTKSEFIGMLLSKEDDTGRDIFRSRLIPFGAENYYLMIREAIEHGFKG